MSEASARISSQSAERILLLYKQGPPRANTARAPLRNQNNCANLYLNYSRIKINVLPCSTSSFSSAGMRRENNLSWFTPSLSFSVSLFLSRPLYGSRRIINSARPLSRQYCRLDRPLRFSAACVHCPATAYNGGFCAGVCFERCQQLSQLPSGRWQTLLLPPGTSAVKKWSCWTGVLFHRANYRSNCESLTSASRGLK